MLEIAFAFVAAITAFAGGADAFVTVADGPALSLVWYDDVPTVGVHVPFTHPGTGIAGIDGPCDFAIGWTGKLVYAQTCQRLWKLDRWGEWVRDDHVTHWDLWEIQGP